MNWMPVAVVRCRGRWEVRLAGRLIRIRTRAGGWMLARFDTWEAANAYRWCWWERVGGRASGETGTACTPGDRHFWSERDTPDPKNALDEHPSHGVVVVRFKARDP